MSHSNRDNARALWGDLARRDFAAVAARFAPEGHYTDVCAPEEGATGPAEIEARLRLGLEPLVGYELHDGLIVAEGDAVITEHSETWVWDSEHSVTLPFVSVMTFDGDGRVTRWWDYWDLGTVMGSAPPWWLERVAAGYR